MSWEFKTKDTQLCRIAPGHGSNKNRTDIDVDEPISSWNDMTGKMYPIEEDFEYYQYRKDNPLITIGPWKYGVKDKFVLGIRPIPSIKDIDLIMSKEDLEQLYDNIAAVLNNDES